MGDDQAHDDAAEIVRLAFAQAERLTAQADAARRAAEAALADAKAEADRILLHARTERETLIADARRDRVAAEEAMLRARSEAEREASDVLAAPSELARREAEILLDGSRMELLRARDEATEIRAAAERDADAILAAAATRARSTSAELLAATRRRMGANPPLPSAGRGDGDDVAPPGPGAASTWGGGIDLADRPAPPAPPPGASASMALVPIAQSAQVPVIAGVAVLELPRPLVPPEPEAGRAYTGVRNRTPQPADIDQLVESAVLRAVQRASLPTGAPATADSAAEGLAGPDYPPVASALPSTYQGVARWPVP